MISTLQQRTLQGAAETKGYALSICEERKMAAHAISCRAVGVSFIPLAIESLGGWSELGAKTINHIGCLLSQRLGICTSTTSRHLFQRCSVSLWRGNAALWLNRFPPVSSFIDSIIGKKIVFLSICFYLSFICFFSSFFFFFFSFVPKHNY